MMPKLKFTADGISALDAARLRIIKSLNARIAHVVGSASATCCIQAGSKSIGHQQPPIAAIVMITIAPTGRTASRVLPTPATIKPKAAPAKATAAAGIINAAGGGPGEIPN